MITVSKDIISKSVAPNKAMDMIRRDSIEDDYIPRKKKGKRRTNKGGRDPFHQITMDDLNQDSDPESQSLTNDTNNNKNGHNSNRNNKNSKLSVTTNGNKTDTQFAKQDVTPTIAPKSALSAMMEQTRDALVADAEVNYARMTVAMARYNSSGADAQGGMDNGSSRRVSKRNDPMDAMIPSGGRQKRDTIRNGRNVGREEYFDSSDEEPIQTQRSQIDSDYSGNENINTMKVYVEEFKNDEPFKVSIYRVQNGKQNINFPKTANDIIIEVYQKCVDSNRILKGASVGDYVLREWDDDEPGDLTMDGTAKINELQYCDAVCICYVGSGNGTVGDINAPPTLSMQAKMLSAQRSLSPEQAANARSSRSVTVDQLNASYGVKKVFVRIQVPGPMNDKFTFQIDNESGALNVRDLCMLLNKKKNQIYFNPQYFDFYYEGLTSSGLEGPINKQTKVLDLKKRELVILPKNIKNDLSNEEKDRAFAFPLVKLANEVSKFKAVKIKNNAKKSRLLTIDRFRVTKESLDDKFDDKFKKKFLAIDKVPIEITSITSIKINSDNNAQFILHYNHPNGGNRKHIYELANRQECSHCVSKIKYLVTLRRLQG